MSQTPAVPDFKPPSQRERAKEYQLESLAQLSVLGVGSAAMAGITELSETYINRILRGGQSKKFDELREQYKRSHLKTISNAHFQLVDALPEAIEGIKEGLGSRDIRVKTETSWKLYNQVVPQMVNQKDKADSFNITLNEPHIQAQVGETMTTVAKALQILTSVIRGQDADQYVMAGTDALPIPPSQLEVEEGEVELVVDRKGEDDLLTELIEREDE